MGTRRFMKKLFVLCLISLSFGCLFAQEDEEGKDPDTPENSKPLESIRIYEPIRKEDKYVKMGLTLNIPLFNTKPKDRPRLTNIYPGGSFYFGFAYFVTNRVSLGGSLSFDFYATLGTNLYFAVPFTFDVTYTFTHAKWRFPIGIGVGGNFQTYNATKYFGMIFRPEVGFYYQYSIEWSFGATLAWNVIPQWYKDKGYNRTGNILGLSFVARYHF